MRRLATVFIGLAALMVSLIVGVLVVSELRLRDVTRPPAFVAEIPTDDDAIIAHGEHIARIRGCFGCHGQQLQGVVFTDQWPWVRRAVAPNLARHAREHSVAELELAIRQGIGGDGKALWSMPSYNWRNLSDSDLSALIAYLRAAPITEVGLPKPSLGLKARWWIASGQEQHMADWSQMVPALQLQDHPNPMMRQGEYLAMTMCNECHGLDLRGSINPDGATPDLAILAAYTEADFRVLMKTGTAIGGRSNLPLMSMIARDRFASLTESELKSLLLFLRTLPGQPITENVPWRS
ncbi:MAG: cytochrome c [Gammaproteobacteria bacterium]|nr:cytochrome c [Gammaproteobacteria bacterium]